MPGAGAGPVHEDFAHVGDVEEAHALADSGVLGQDVCDDDEDGDGIPGRRLEPHITALPGRAVINVNTATPAVLLSLDEKLTPPGSPQEGRTGQRRRLVTVELVVEVSDSTLGFDRTRKLALYARNRIPEYWILNLTDRRLELYRQPENDTYTQSDRYGPDEALTRIAGRDCRVPVADLLP